MCYDYGIGDDDRKECITKQSAAGACPRWPNLSRNTTAQPDRHNHHKNSNDKRIVITRSSKDEYSNGDQTIILGLKIFLDHRSSRTIDQKL